MTIKVLILEDDPDDLELARDLIEETGIEGLEILGACDVASALKVTFQASEPGLVLADQNLEGDTGATFLNIALQRCPRLVAVLLTGHTFESLPGEVRSDLAMGVYRYLAKQDLNVEILRELIGQTCARVDPDASRAPEA